MINDPIADMLTRIRNGGRARLMRVKIPKSKIKVELARVLRERGYIAGYSDDPDAAKPTLCVEIRYGDDARPVIEGIQRISSPGRRVYVGWKEVPRVRNGTGIAILSTNRGILTDDQAREAHVGGEVLARIW